MGKALLLADQVLRLLSAVFICRGNHPMFVYGRCCVCGKWVGR